MDSINLDGEAQETNLTGADNSSTDDIKFEEVFDINDIEKKLNLDAAEFAMEEKKIQEIETEKQSKSVKALPAKTTTEKNVKKYVIHIDSENIDYIESLSTEARKELINKILAEQNESAVTNRERAHLKKFTTHAIVSCITFIIAFPLLFLMVNKATEITIENYNKSKENFTRLYKKQGKVQIKSIE